MWRETSKEFLEIGRGLGVIEGAMKSVRATAAVDDSRVKAQVGEAYAASLKIVKALDTLRRQLSEEK